MFVPCVRERAVGLEIDMNDMMCHGVIGSSRVEEGVEGRRDGGSEEGREVRRERR